jgi:hypothetical protein
VVWVCFEHVVQDVKNFGLFDVIAEAYFCLYKFV